MRCPDCGKEVKHSGTSSTLVGYGHFTDDQGHVHDHNDNCLKRRYVCECGNQWIESKIRTCGADNYYRGPDPVPGCTWQGNTECFCHGGPKVKEWTDQ